MSTLPAIIRSPWKKWPIDKIHLLNTVDYGIYLHCNLVPGTPETVQHVTMVCNNDVIVTSLIN